MRDDKVKHSDDKAKHSEDKAKHSEDKATMSEDKAKHSEDRAETSDDKAKTSSHEMLEAAPSTDGHNRTIAFARRHPALTVVGATGAGLLGGIELAAGILIGAGVLALISGRVPAESHAPREHAREKISRVRPEVTRRVRAMVEAARGHLPPPA